MSPWRDSASQQAQNDLDELLNASLGFAQVQLAEHGEYFPYAMVIGRNDRSELISVRPRTTDETPSSEEVIASCRAAVRERRNELRAVAFVYEVRLVDSGDAIQVDLEHAEGSALTVHLPFVNCRSANSVEYGQLSASMGISRTWSQ